MSKAYDEKPAVDQPYTVVSHTAIPHPVASILLTGKGIKALAAQVGDDDMVRIKHWSDFTDEGNTERYHQRITILKKVEQ